MQVLEISEGHISLDIIYHSRTFNHRQISKLATPLRTLIPELAKFLACKRPDGLGIDIKKLHGIELSLTICGNEKIRKLNQNFRKKDKVTDVLSFPILEDIRGKKTTDPMFTGILSLGDIIICNNVAQKQAKQFAISFEHEVLHLFVHGFLHLLGFDHEISAKEEQIMQKHEDQLIAKVLKVKARRAVSCLNNQ